MVDKVILQQLIITRGKWLSSHKGLCLQKTMDDILEQYKTRITEDEVERFEKGISILRKTNFPNIEDILKKSFPFGIKQKKNIKFNGEWSIVNKLNTSYHSITDMLVSLIDKMVNDNSNKEYNKLGTDVYGTILSGDKNIQNGLLLLKDDLKELITHYFKTIEDFTEVCDYIIKNTEDGDISEQKAIEYYKNNDYEILYTGGNGDMIDIHFGCDIILHHKKKGYKTVQVKSYKINPLKVDYYQTDYITQYHDGEIKSFILGKLV